MQSIAAFPQLETKWYPKGSMGIGSLLIRADASATIGAGHVMRCIALAQAWQDAGGRAIFALARETPWLRSRLRSEGMDVHLLEEGYSEKQESARLAQLARDCEASWTVVDGYHFGGTYLRELKTAGLKLLLLDDAGLNEECAADIILNANSNATESMYPHCGTDTKLLLGSKYVLLRREFAAWAQWKRQTASKVRQILVTMGGSDPDNVTQIVLKALILLKDKNIIHTIIAGGDNPRLEILQAQASSNKGNIRVVSATSNVPEMMAQSDLSIIAAGGTLWELMYMSCPVVSFSRNSTQRRVLEQLHSRGVVLHMGDPIHVFPNALAQVLDDLSAAVSRRAKMAALGREQVDGEGAKRVCEILTNSV